MSETSVNIPERHARAVATAVGVTSHASPSRAAIGVPATGIVDMACSVVALHQVAERGRALLGAIDAVLNANTRELEVKADAAHLMARAALAEVLQGLGYVTISDKEETNGTAA